MIMALHAAIALAFLCGTPSGLSTPGGTGGGSSSLLQQPGFYDPGEHGSNVAGADTPVANIFVKAKANATGNPRRQGWTVDGNWIVVPFAAVALLVVLLAGLFVASRVSVGMAPGASLFNDKEVQKIFALVDTDKSGTLSMEEVRAYMKEQGHPVPDNQLTALMEMADVDKSGELDADEFRILLTNIRDENPKDLVRCLIAEMVGMMIFQFLGGMPDTGPQGNWLLVVGLIYCFASISGAHFNPAITLAVWKSGQIPLKKAIMYVVVNILAAVDAVLWLRWLGIQQIDSDSGTPLSPCTAPPTVIPISVLFLLEAVCTFTFVLVFLGVALDSKSAWGNIAPLVLGVIGYGVSSASGKISGVSMNPGRFLGPCIGYGCFPGTGRTIAYLLSALVGSYAATALYVNVFMNRPPPDLAGGMANFQFMVRDCTVMKKELANHRRSTMQKARG